MNRRNFLRSGSLVAIAATGLPKAVRSMGQHTHKLQDDDGPVTYKTSEAPKGGMNMYEITIYHNAVDNFKAAKDTEKIINMKVAFFLSTDLTKPDTKGEYQYKIKKSEQSKSNVDEWIVTTKLDKKISGDHSFNSDYPKNMKFTIKENEYIEIMSKKGDYVLDTVPLEVEGASSGSSSGGCFLTTACVIHKKLADDCYELQQLRQLRDQYMLADDAGIALVKQYYNIGPSIVSAINSCDNKAEIYEYMYQNMILPSVALTTAGKHEEAVTYYKVFVKALAEKYN